LIEENSQIGDEEYRQSECRIKVEADQAQCPEQALHHQICYIVEEVEGEEAPCRTIQTRHKIDDDAEQ